MANYGSYETVREISGDLVGAVHIARRAGADDGAEYAVKFIAKAATSTSGGFFAEVAGTDEGDRTKIFAAAIELQKTAAQSSSLVAPVLESGNTQDGTWYATYFYPRTAQKLIQGRVVMSEAGVRHVLLAAARGAQSFRQTCQRGHGNLKPSNILIGGNPKITEAEVRVADPSGKPESQPGEHELADLKSLGALLYQLVHRKEISGSTDWLILPLEKTRAWTETFGKRADAWLELCNRLLDPNLDPAAFPLDEVVAALERLESKPPISLRAVALVAVFTLMGVAGLWLGAQLVRSEPKNVVITVDPPGVEVEVAGRNYGRIDEKGLALTLEPGRYSITGRYTGGEGPHDDLLTYTNLIEVENMEVVQQIPIYMEYGSLEITSQPEGASIHLAVEDARVGNATTNRYFDTGFTTPHVIPIVRSGERQVLLRKDGHVRTNLTVNVPANQEPARIAATLTEEIPGSVEVAFYSTPFPATVTETSRGELSFVTDTFRSLLPGEYVFTATSRNFGTITTNLTVSPRPDGKGMELLFRFPNAEVRLRSRPPGARVYVDDTNVTMNAEAEGQRVTDYKVYWPPGETTFRFELAGYYTNTMRTNLVAGREMNLMANLTPMMGVLELTCMPPGSPVEFLVHSNGQPIMAWTTNLADGAIMKLQQPPGTYVMEARHPALGVKYLTNRAELGVVKRWPLRFDHGLARFRVMPPGVGETEVALDGQALGPRVREELVLSPGAHPYAATNSVLGVVTGAVAVADNQLTPVTIAFPYGFMTITSLPPRAEIFEERPDGGKGIKLGESPLVITSRLGQANFVMEHGTNKPYTLRATLAQGANPERGRDFTKFVPDSVLNSIGMELVWLEEPAGYWVGKHEVTQEEFMKVMEGSNPSMFPGNPKMPVENVTWNEAQAFCDKLTELESGNGALPTPGMVYRLPTDAEWNYFMGDARAEDAVFTSSAKPRASPENVGSTELPNLFGLYDVLGNVAEITIATDFAGIKTQGGSYLNRSHKGLFGTTFGNEAKDQRLAGTGFRVIVAPDRQ